MERGVTAASDDVLALAQLVRQAASVVALTGAGISVPSGIPDFRTPGTGIWENVDPMEVAHIDAWHTDPERFWGFYGQRFQTLGDKPPNGAHEALVELETRGLLDAVITQNIDMLHRRVVNPAPDRASKARYSMPYFLHFRPDFVIEALPGTVPAGEEPKWPPISSHEYLQERLREIKLK